MKKIALVYGGISGAVVILAMVLGLFIGNGEVSGGSMTVGYLIMLVALSCIFIGIKRYRDTERGGVIKFLPAFGLGLLISLCAAISYALSWELYLAVSGYAYVEHVTPEFPLYSNPLVRFPITMTEIFPVGLIISLISALILRNPKVLPARG